MNDTTSLPTREEWARACKLIDFMAAYIGKMAPGNYSDVFADLNEHFITAAKTQASPAVMK